MITLDEMKNVLAGLGVDIHSVDFNLLTDIALDYGYDYDEKTGAFTFETVAGTYTLDEVKDHLKAVGYALDDFTNLDDIITLAGDLDYVTEDGVTFTIE